MSNAGRLETTDKEKADSFMGYMGSAHSLCVSVDSIRLKNAVSHSESKARSIPYSCPVLLIQTAESFPDLMDLAAPHTLAECYFVQQ